MPSESATILIDAEDKASAKLKSVAQAAEANVKQIKTVGGSAKASTELIGTLANQLGSSGIGGFAGELAQLTERISAFSEVSKAGGAGALAFKAGLSAAVGVVAFKFGNMIGEAIFQTEKWNRVLETSIERNRQIGDELESRRSSVFDEQIEAIREIEDIEERRAAANKLQLEIAQNMTTPERQLAEIKKQITEREDSYFHSLMSIGGEYRAHHQILQAQAEELEKRLTTEQKRKQMLLEISAGEAENQRVMQQQAREEKQKQERSAEFLQSLRDELELLRASKEERYAIEAARGTANPEDQSEAERLLRERDAIEEKRKAEEEAERERKRIADERKRDAESEANRMIELRKGLIEKLQQEAIGLRDGQIAAKAYALELKGVDKATAKKIAEAESLLGNRSSTPTSLTAKDTRLLTRGGSDSAANKTAANTERAAKLLEEVVRALDEVGPQQSIELKVATA